MRASKGFTLIEVLIAMTILATLGILAAQAITSGVKAKKRIQEQIDEVSRLRDAVKLMERDINLAFHHQDWEKDLQDLIKKKSTPAPTTPQPVQPPSSGSGPGSLAGQLAAPTPNPSAAEEKREVPRQDPVTHFIGTEDTLNFVTMNNTRMTRELKQADFIEVGYSLKDCKSADGKSSSKCLWRRTSSFVDDDPTKGGEEMVLLENVTEFSLKYLGVGKQDWVKDWNTKGSQEESIKNKFPWAVEISMTSEKKVDSKKAKKYSMQVIAPIHFPNNIDTTKTTDPSTPQTPTTPNNGGVGP